MRIDGQYEMNSPLLPPILPAPWNVSKASIFNGVILRSPDKSGSDVRIASDQSLPFYVILRSDKPVRRSEVETEAT